MAKEKYSHYEKEQKDLTFYYEIVGILCIIIPILGFARLGSIGFYVMLIFKIIFGDWYFLFLLTILCYGLRCLIYHKPMDLKRMRVIGIVLILLGIMILSHFPMHKYLVSFDTENTGGYFRKTLGLYLDYFKNYYDGMVVGGGIIGAIFFYMFYSLVSTIGTSFMIIVFIFVGLVFFTEKTINEFLGIIFKRVIKVYKFFQKKFKSFKYEIKVPIPNKHKIRYSDLIESDKIKYESLELKKALEYKEKLAILLNKLNIFYGEIIITVGYNVTTFLIDSVAYIDMALLNSKIKTKTDNNFLIKKDVKTKKTIIEINNLYESPLDIKNALDLQNNKEAYFEFPIGITTLKELKIINTLNIGNLLIEDSEGNSINFLKALITMYYIKNKLKDFKIIYFNEKIGINKFKKTFDINQIIELVNNTLNKLNEESVNNIDEYNDKNPKERLRHYLLIITDNELQNKDVNDKLVFILQVSNKIGFFMIFLTKDKGLLDIVYENYFDLQLHFKNSKSMEVSKQITPLECFLTYKGEIERITPVSLSNKEFEEFKDRY